MSADLYKSLEAFVFGMNVFVEVNSFVVAAAELPVNLLHTICTDVGKLFGNTREVLLRSPVHLKPKNPEQGQLLTWVTSTAPMLRMRTLLLFRPSADDALFVSSSRLRNCECASNSSSRRGKI